MALTTDEEYRQKIFQGNKTAFDQFFLKYYLTLRSYSCKIVKDINTAEDIVQDIFFNIWVKRDQLKDVSNIAAYVRTAVHNQSISVLRNRNRNLEVTIDNSNLYSLERLYSEIFQYQDTFLNKELSLKIGEAINNLPDHCRSVFILSRTLRFKNKEIASHLNISVKAVEKQITKALVRLRDELKEYLIQG